MESGKPHAKDPWEDDWDWEWSAEPAVTYRDAVDQLRSLVQSRPDVRIDWNGQRGRPRDEARVVFTGTASTGELRVRFRSATQLSDFTQIISSATLLTDRHGLWYPGEQKITARLVGDYDQLHAAVARYFAPKRSKRHRFVADSLIGRDVAGILASVGAYPAAEANATGVHPRTIRLESARRDLRALYGPHGSEVPSVAIEMTGFAVPDVTLAEKTLLEYGTAYLFNLAKATGVSLRLWRSEYRLGSRRPSGYSDKVRFPRQRYDPYPAELYAAGNSAGREPVERYLKYYQILEFYMTKAADVVAASQGVTVGRAISPLRPAPNNRLATEQNKLDAVIGLALVQAQLMNLLGDKELFATLSDPRVVQDVQSLTADPSGQPVSGRDYRLEVSTRIYNIRNRIVHMKEGGGRKSQKLLAPYSRDARDLAADLRLARFLAEHTMEYWATPL